MVPQKWQYQPKSGSASNNRPPKYGTSRVEHTIIGYEFTTDKGNSNTLRCMNLLYGAHEPTIILDQIGQLSENGRISEWAGQWCSMIVLAAKPH